MEEPNRPFTSQGGEHPAPAEPDFFAGQPLLLPPAVTAELEENRIPPEPPDTEDKTDEPDEKLTAQALISLIDNRQYAVFKAVIEEYNPADICELFDEIPEEYDNRVFRLLTKEQAAQVFIGMDSERQEHIISSYTDKELSEMLDEMYLDDTVDLIEEMPANVVKRILRNSSASDRETINRLLRYPKDSAGTIMTTEYVRFTAKMTVAEALAHIRNVAIDKETIYTCYVTDRDRHLEGIVTAKRLLISPLGTVLGDIMEDNVISVRTTDDKEQVALQFDRYGFLAMPVVDGENRLVGIVTFDDAISVLREETEEDFAKMAGITPSETTYLKTGALRLFLARIPWLLILMVSATFSSTILNFFEAALPAVLILFVPMLMDTGGNSGSQSSVTLIRGLSLGEVAFSDFFVVLWKEVRVGLLCGGALGAVAFAKVMLVDRLIMHNPAVTVIVALAVAVALAMTVLIAKIIGCMLPLLAKKVGFDPAVMASPFITTIVDALSLLTYFFIASRVFHL